LPDSVPVANPARAAMQGNTTPLPLPSEVITPPSVQPRIVEQPTDNFYTNPTESRYTPTPIQPSSPTRTTVPQPRRVQDMSEEQAVALDNPNTTPRLNPHMAIALNPRTTGDNAAPTVTGTYHKVINGDNLYLIAQRYYNDGKLWRLIRDANPTLVTNEGAIMLGSRLLIPSQKQVQQNQNTQGQPASTSAPREIVVESGQTLSELAKIHLGNAGDWDELLKANRDRLSRPEELRAGMTLRLPAKAVERASARTTTSNTTTRTAQPGNTATSSAKTYTVESGDTLSAIAAKTMGSSNKWYKLYQHNKSVINDPDNLTVGVTIKIP
jgi:nucleoid-associated protein YgaU